MIDGRAQKKRAEMAAKIHPSSSPFLPVLKEKGKEKNRFVAVLHPDRTTG